MQRLLLHLTIALSAALVLFFILIGTHFIGTRETPISLSIVAIEYREKAEVTFSIARKEHVSIVTIKNTGNDLVRVSIPELWKQREVHGTSVSAARPTSERFGFVRWLISPRASVSFTIEDVPTALEFTSPSKGIAAINLVTVDLRNGEKKQETILLHGERKVELWE